MDLPKGSTEQTHVQHLGRWLANRSFNGQDRVGRIVIGTTDDAFFTLDRSARLPIEQNLTDRLRGTSRGATIDKSHHSIRIGGTDENAFVRSVRSEADSLFSASRDQPPWTPA